jgi:hypothetical protein
MGWLHPHESLAIWLEGVALVLIFIWDRLDSRIQHKEVLAQLQAAEKQIEVAEKNAAAAKATAESVVNAERAWVFAELSWWEKSDLRIVHGTSQVKSGPVIDTTSVNLKLTCRNEGRTPAWIDNVYGHLEIITGEFKAPNRTDGRNFGPMGPLGAGKQQAHGLDLTCPGYKYEASLAVYVVIEYRDIFGVKRETSLGHAIDSHGNIYRQDALSDRNKNT